MVSLILQENIRLEEIEKRRQRRKTEADKSPVNSDDIVDNLLHEIRDGTKLRHRRSK